MRPHRAITIGSLLVAAACASGSGAGSAQTADGSTILRRSCTQCHDLRGLTAYQDYWGEPEWREMVQTMVTYGAELSPAEVPVLSQWLAERYGTARGN